MFRQTLRDPRKFRPRKSIIFAQTHWSSRAIQIEHRLTPSTNYMHMRRPMIIEIDSHPQAAKSQDRWHTSSYHNPKRLGY
jgi:hypothetical protein